MNIRNILELVVVLGTSALLIPLYLKKKKELRELDGFEIVEDKNCPDEETIIIRE